MALIPLIQPPIMKLLTTDKERKVKMVQTRKVRVKAEKIIFPIVVVVCSWPAAALRGSSAGPADAGQHVPRVRRCGASVDTAQNALMNISTICWAPPLALPPRLQLPDPQTLGIIAMGLVAFAFAPLAACCGKVLYLVTGGKINPLIGSAGVSAVPMAARVAQNRGSRTTAPTSC